MLRTTFFWLVMFGVQMSLLFATVFFSGKYLLNKYPHRIVPYLAMIEDLTQNPMLMKELTTRSSGMWVTVADPKVGRIGMPHRDTIFKKARNIFNAAGMRSRKQFTVKDPAKYRIVCLGDSMVMGEAGREQDRFCDQIEDFFHQNNILMEAKEVETLAVGLGSWNMTQACTYLKTRLSAYDPDLIIVTTNPNDITSSSGVDGYGNITSKHSPEERSWGSAALFDHSKVAFRNILSTHLCHSCRLLWKRSIQSLKSLVELQTQRGKKILLSVLDPRQVGFDIYFRRSLADAKIKQPLVRLNYNFPRLLHDNHPDRQGHKMLANHYLHAMKKLGWMKAPKTKMPSLEKYQTLTLENSYTSIELARINRTNARRVYNKIDFQELNDNHYYSILGGFFSSADSLPWASIRTGFVLSLGKSKEKYLELAFNLPKKVELYPMKMRFEVDGKSIGNRRYQLDDAGNQVVKLPLPSSRELGEIAEFMIYTDTYFSGFLDHRMRSFQLKSVTLVEGVTLLSSLNGIGYQNARN